MFHNYSFEAASRHPSNLDAYHPLYLSISPTSTPAPQSSFPTPTAVSVAQLVQRFDEHKIQPDTSSYFYPHAAPTEDLNPTYDSASSSRHHSSSSDSPIRLQRQAQTQLQCDTAHLRDISALVQRMIESGDQCAICNAPSPSSDMSSASSEDGDEAIADVDVDLRPRLSRSSTAPLPVQALMYRRSFEAAPKGARVAKVKRCRKPHQGRHGTR